MSGRDANPTLNRRSHRVAKFFLAMGLLTCAVIVGSGVRLGVGNIIGSRTVGATQPPVPPPGVGTGGIDQVDERPPLPPAEPSRALIAEKFRIPNRDRRIFKGFRDARTGKQDGGIVDFEPVATEKQNQDEYFAWTEVIQHAKQFPAVDLEEYAGRDLVVDDLVGPQYASYRLDLLRFEGKLTKVRRLPGTVSLEQSGTAEIYEAQLVPFDEPPTDFVSIVFTELPHALAAVKEKRSGEWMEVEAYASAAGYFFKIKQDAPRDDKVAILIGKSLTVRKGPTPVSSVNPPNTTSGTNGDGNSIALDRNLRIFKFIKDDAFTTDTKTRWEEVVAWNRVLLHARRFMPEDLEANARTDLKFADLFQDIRRDYKLQLVKFEGRLLMLRKMEPSQKLLAAGLESAYEGWLVPKDEPRGNPVSIVFTDPPDGIEPVGRVNKWVSFAGYSFKLTRYESGERDKDDPKKYVIKRAPLLLGRAIITRTDPDAPSSISWSLFTWIAVGVIGSLLGIAGGLTWWFRRGDRRARREIEGHRGKNPFGEQGGGGSSSETRASERVDGWTG